MKKLIVFLLAFLCIGSFVFFLVAQRSSSPNVLLITIDTLRSDHLGCYGYRRNTSPNIDRFAKEGVLFTQAIGQGSNTLLSLPSIMTSLYPSQHGVGLVDAPVELAYYSSGLISHPLLAEILNKNGYYTGAIVAHGEAELLADVGLGKGIDLADFKAGGLIY